MKRPLKWIVVALIALLLIGGIFRAIGARRAQQAALASAAAPTETAVQLGTGDVLRVAQRELVQALPVSGTLRAIDSAVVKARVAGELRGLTVREGDSVTAGQIIARVDPTEYQSRVAQAREQADAARAQAEVARRSYDNNKALVEQGFISKTALDTSLSSLNSALATHRAALAAVDMMNKSLDDTILRSPIAGLVAQRLVQPGERVGIDTRVIEVVDLRQLEVEATLSAADSVAVRIGQRASLQIEGGGVAPTGNNDRRVGAGVLRINPTAQAGSRNVLVYLRLDSSTGFRQGLFAQGTIDVGRERSLALPLNAVRIDKPSPYVQAVVDGRIVHRPVELGSRGEVDGQAMVSVKGLDEGAVVVAGTVGALREGTSVKLAAGLAP
ncbi:RND family efflux transporter, MFP subunit [Burkholderiales bacterium 8X]|nr:RND family efflux transporter, MFP subunit [Burkholderiales bacterium 8X]